mgnify:CR=1 FL=1
MNSKICAGTEMSEDAYYGLKGNNPEVYDPSGSLLFPRDGDYADGDGNYVNAIAIVQTEGYDATRAEAFNATIKIFKKRRTRHALSNLSSMISQLQRAEPTSVAKVSMLMANLMNGSS